MKRAAIFSVVAEADSRGLLYVEIVMKSFILSIAALVVLSSSGFANPDLDKQWDAAEQKAEEARKEYKALDAKVVEAQKLVRALEFRAGEGVTGATAKFFGLTEGVEKAEVEKAKAALAALEDKRAAAKVKMEETEAEAAAIEERIRKKLGVIYPNGSTTTTSGIPTSGSTFPKSSGSK